MSYWLLALSAGSGLLAVGLALLARSGEMDSTPAAHPARKQILTHATVAAAILCGLALFAWIGVQVADDILHGDDEHPGIGY